MSWSSYYDALKQAHGIWTVRFVEDGANITAETREDAHAPFDLFVETFEAKHPKATECLITDREELLTFYDVPAQLWQSIRTSNPIESAFATIRLRSKRAKGCLSRDGMLHIPLVTFFWNALTDHGCSNSDNAPKGPHK